MYTWIMYNSFFKYIITALKTERGTSDNRRIGVNRQTDREILPA